MKVLITNRGRFTMVMEGRFGRRARIPSGGQGQLEFDEIPESLKCLERQGRAVLEIVSEKEGKKRPSRPPAQRMPLSPPSGPTGGAE